MLQLSLRTRAALVSMIVLGLPACSDDHDHDHSTDSTSEESTEPDHGGQDHEHNEESLGSVTVGDMTVELAQGHGHVVPGGESQLVVKLPYTDGGSTIVRAWLGTQDRTMSYVGLGEYAASHDDYDIHVTAPDPLPSPLLWWFELESPEGDKQLGSVAPLVK